MSADAGVPPRILTLACGYFASGLFGIKWFLMALADGNQNDIAYEVLTTPTYPSFKWMMNNEVDNATTIW